VIENNGTPVSAVDRPSLGHPGLQRDLVCRMPISSSANSSAKSLILLTFIRYPQEMWITVWTSGT
jgi:hypothetical protein